MDENYTLDEIIENYKKIGILENILKAFNDSESAEQFSEAVEKYQRQTNYDEER